MAGSFDALKRWWKEVNIVERYQSVLELRGFGFLESWVQTTLGTKSIKPGTFILIKNIVEGVWGVVWTEF